MEIPLQNTIFQNQLIHYLKLVYLQTNEKQMLRRDIQLSPQKMFINGHDSPTNYFCITRF